MNPSSSGWIKKHLPVFEKEIRQKDYTQEEFYTALRQAGFIYANSLKTISYPKGTKLKLNLKELSKINLLDGLAFTYFTINPQATHEDFVQTAIDFYQYLKKHSYFNFKIPFLKHSPQEKLEKIIDERLKTNHSTLEKNFSSLVSNALLYLEVLVFRHYLKTDTNPSEYAQSLEALLANTIYIALTQKSDKDEYDQLVIAMLEASIRYNKIDEVILKFKDLNYKKHQLPLECLYILDLACMTVYADSILEPQEEEYIQHLGQLLGFKQPDIQESINFSQLFMKKNQGQIFFLDASNPIKNLYDNTSQTVSTLILRNKNRLIKEIRQSKELVELLGKSTTSELNEEEKQKVKNELLDICKIVPSLAIFILPGGSILLPILIKFIPNLLPSAFDDNK